MKKLNVMKNIVLIFYIYLELNSALEVYRTAPFRPQIDVKSLLASRYAHQKREAIENLRRKSDYFNKKNKNWTFDNLVRIFYDHKLPYSHMIDSLNSIQGNLSTTREYKNLSLNEIHQKLTDQWYERLKNYAQWLNPFQWRQFLQNGQDYSSLLRSEKMKVNIPLLEAVIIGIKRAVEECQFQMKNEKWNCTIMGEDKSSSLFGNLLIRGIPETAFVHSLVNAGVLQSVAEACHQRISDCPCDNRGRRQNPTNWQWYGCDHNIFYARKLTRKLFDSMEMARNIRFMMNRHNNVAGRRNVALNMELYCRCHGASGSCTLKTCYRRIPSMRSIGTVLKARYENAIHLKSESSETMHRMQRSPNFPAQGTFLMKRPQKRTHLVYYEKTHDKAFCEPIPDFNILGTHGRICNSTQGAGNSCDKLCCGRGHETKVVYEMENCNCRFVWCCKVECEKCLVVKVKERCK